MDEMEKLADLRRVLYPVQGPSEQLRARALARVEPRRRWRAPVLVGAGAAAIAAGVIALAPHGGQRAAIPQPAAFAVQVNPDGSVAFTAHDVVDTAAATQALNQAGIAGRVINDITPGCSTKSDDIQPADLFPDGTVSRGLGSQETVTLRTSDYPAGGGLLVVVTGHGGGDGRGGPGDPVSVAIFAFDRASKVPTCVDFADPSSTSGPK